MMLTRNEAIERAAKIWGARVVVNGPFRLAITCVSGATSATHDVEWWIDTPDGLHHGLDANGHTTCHRGCADLEARL